ncbi:MAG: S8 family serine peptidase [Gammaproteobacteria bacterium]
MNTFRKNIALLMVWVMATQPLLAAVPAGSVSATAGSEKQTEATGLQQSAGVELTGELDDRSAEMRAEMYKDHEPGMAEDGTPMPKAALASLPVVDTKLAERARSISADEELRVLIHLGYQPHGQVLKETMLQHKSEVDALESTRVAFLKELEQERSLDTERDSEDYANMFSMSEDQSTALRAMNERNEALSHEIKEAVTAQLRGMIDQSQEPVIDAVTQLGGTVEFSTIAGNVIVALVPASAIDELGKTPGIMRLVEDSVMEGHLNVADRATNVDPIDASLMGLWDANLTGGIYDPAILDSGLDLQHPAMRDSVSPLRDNFGSWYLVAANGSANFDDMFTQDDLQGHGTHVAGIVASYGSPGFTQHLGMAHGVEKVVNLKAGWQNTSGTASMFWSDKYNLVDRAIYNSGALQPSNSFNDDVDGFNLSYGGATTLDDTDGSRFWDSVISTVSDTPVTISAGNSGPSNTLFSDPAISYNAIAVANAQDRNTSSRDDDIIRPSSTVGPTASGRRKPDLAAPGSFIVAPNHNWEGGASDHVSKTGTSMAAPMVLGVIMDLMDAGVFDELAIKALLINTAQKNLNGLNIEDDPDGWDPQIGWGYMNAFAAYFHRFDTFSDSLAPRGTAGEYQLYKGSMRDENFPGEGRDRATMTWNRAATYDTADTPSEFFNLSDLNMRLYNEANNALIDSDLSGLDNVHQVRIGNNAPDTDVVINAYAWSSSFANGNDVETFALATEDGFTRVEHPDQFQGIAIWPTSVEPNEVFDVTFWLRNDSELASHNNIFDFVGNNGFTLVSGAAIQNVGTVAGDGGITTMVNYQVRAPVALGAASFAIAHSHNSYNVPYGNFNWNLNTTVEVDVTSPNPNPMSFSSAPAPTGTSSIGMTASFATDIHADPITYYLDFMSSPSGGFGGTDSGWQESRVYSDLGLQVNDEYCYRAWARDSANSPNNTTPSAVECAYTLQVVPPQSTVTTVTSNSVTMQPFGTPNNLSLDQSGIRIDETGTGATSGWQQNTAPFVFGGFQGAQTVKFETRSRNGDGIVTATQPAVVTFTLANPPAANSLEPTSQTEIKVALSNNNNQEAQYQIQNTTAGTASNWSSSLQWVSSGLTCGTDYNFQARARNQNGIETIIVPLGSESTFDCSVDTDGDGVEDSSDNCTLIANSNQRDTNGDGYGNACDPDLNNDGTVNFVDISLFSGSFPGSGVGLDEDFNGDNLVNFIDYILFTTFFLDPPGPSGVAP